MHTPSYIDIHVIHVKLFCVHLYPNTYMYTCIHVDTSIGVDVCTECSASLILFRMCAQSVQASPIPFRRPDVCTDSSGASFQPLSLSLSELLSMPRKFVRCINGASKLSSSESDW